VSYPLRHYEAHVTRYPQLARVTGTVRRRLAWIAVFVALFLATVGFDPPLWVKIVQGVLFVGLLFLVGGLAVDLLAKVLVRCVPATLSVANDQLVVEGRASSLIPLAGMQHGRVIPSPEANGARLVVRGSYGVLFDAHVTDAGEARALLWELRLGAGHKVDSFAFFFGLRVTVGADGVLMEWPLLRRSRFIPYSKVVAVRPKPGVVVLAFANGDQYEIATHVTKRASSVERDEAFVERLEDACEAYRTRGGSAPLASLFRGGRTARGWIADLRALGAAAKGGYRSIALPMETLWCIALDPAEPEDVRIGAGLVLQSHLDDQQRSRLRVAAEAAASPRVRVALTAAADGLEDDDALANAIRSSSALARRR
jgi:hypothetical protein